MVSRRYNRRGKGRVLFARCYLNAASPPRKRAESTNARLNSGPPLRKRVCDPIGTDKEKESARWMKSSHHLREISVAIVGTKRFSFVMNLSRPVSRGIDPFAGKRYQR